MKKLSWYKLAGQALMSAVMLMSLPLLGQMKIGDNPRSLNPDALLDMESSNRGLLLPRMALRSTILATPLRTFASGMIVYNTATENDVTPGLYFSDGTKWIKANNPSSAPDTSANQNVFWSLRGNSINPATQFLGTTNAAPLVVRTNNTERMRVTSNGWVGIGTTAPKATLQVKGQLIVDSLGAGNTSTDKILVANPVDGRVKLLSTTPFLGGLQNSAQIVASNGQSIFQTPANITDPNKVFLYRNGVLISFTQNNNNSIVSELPCVQGDQIRIIQFL